VVVSCSVFSLFAFTVSWRMSCSHYRHSYLIQILLTTLFPTLKCNVLMVNETVYYSACYSTMSLPLNMNLRLGLFSRPLWSRRDCDTTFTSLASHRNVSSIDLLPKLLDSRCQGSLQICFTLTSPTIHIFLPYAIDDS